MPFLSNELFACIGDKQQRGDASLYQTHITFSALEIQDEVCHLLEGNSHRESP